MNEIFNDPDKFEHILMIKFVRFLVTLQAMDSKGACFETLFPKTAAQLFSGRYTNWAAVQLDWAKAVFGTT
jgi:hypothetical protein